jgi:hypothetical protein
MEKTDMWLNLASLFLNVIIAFLGLNVFKNISAVNYAIFISFLFFHISQDIVLVKSGIHRTSDAFFFYVSSALLLLTYHFLSAFFSSFYFFFLFWLLATPVILTYSKLLFRKLSVTA